MTVLAKQNCFLKKTTVINIASSMTHHNDSYWKFQTTIMFKSMRKGAVYAVNGCNKMASYNFAHDCKLTKDVNLDKI